MCSFNFSVYAVSLFPNLSKNFLVVIKSITSLLTFRLFVTDVTRLFFLFVTFEPLFSVCCPVVFGVAKVIKFLFLTSVCEKYFKVFFSTLTH